MKVKIENVRLAFPRLFTAERVNGQGEPKYSATFLLDPKHPALGEIREAISSVANEKWGAKAPEFLRKLESELKICLKNGESKEELDGFKGNYYISAINAKRPYVVNRDKTPLTPDDGVLYAGCYVNAVVDIWAMHNQFGKRICCSLLGVQFLRDGDAFSGSSVADDSDFDDISIWDDLEGTQN